MLYNSFLSTYQKYKYDTAIVASWLAATAKQRGYTIPLAAPSNVAKNETKNEASSTPPSSGRLKGKARKLAKQQQTQQQTQNAADGSAKPKYVLAIRDFVPLARFIAQSPAHGAANDKAVVPSYVASALKRVIRVRRTYRSSFDNSQTKGDETADATHAHFVTVLEQVRDILIPDSGDDNSDESPSSGEETANQNMFDTLQVQYPSEQFLNAPDAERPAAPQPANIEYAAEDDAHGSGLVDFALYSLIRDYMSLTAEVSSLWKDFAERKIDLAAAAAGNNMAIELARAIDGEVALVLKEDRVGEGYLYAMYHAMCRDCGEDPDAKELPGDPINFACYDLAVDSLCYSLCLLHSARDALDYQKGITVYYTGTDGYWNAETGHEPHQRGFNPRVMLEQDKGIMMELLSETIMLFESPDMPFHDGLTQGAKIMFETGNIPIWLCFAVQNYLNALHQLGPAVYLSLMELRRFNKLADTLLRIIPDEVPTEGHEKNLKGTILLMRSFLGLTLDGNDPFEIARLANADAARLARPSHFMLHHPLFCGLMLNYMRAAFHNIGVWYCCRPGCVLATTQLYVGLQKHQVQTNSDPVAPWPDLDLLLTLQGKQAFFVGGEVPESLEGSSKNYALSRGVSITHFLNGSNRRKGKAGKVKALSKSRAGSREFKYLAPVSTWIKNRVSTSDDKGRVWNAAVVLKFLQANVNYQSPIPEGAAVAGSQLVRHVADLVHSEIPYTHFNYFILHLTTRKFLQELHHSAPAMGMPPLPRDVVGELSNIVHFIFDMAAWEQETEPKRLASGEIEGILRKVTKRLNSYVSQLLLSSPQGDVSRGTLSSQLTSANFPLENYYDDLLEKV